MSHNVAPRATTHYIYRGDRTAVIDGALRLTYADLHRRVGHLTAALEALGVRPGDRVAALCANSAVMLELHSAVPAHGFADECLQLFGGYGYMNEYPIARLWADNRVQKIYAGTNEIMKEIIARTL